MTEKFIPTNVLVCGSGAREDALVWMLRQSQMVGKIYVAPRNGGTEGYKDCISYRNSSRSSSVGCS